MFQVLTYFSFSVTKSWTHISKQNLCNCKIQGFITRNTTSSKSFQIPRKHNPHKHLPNFNSVCRNREIDKDKQRDRRMEEIIIDCECNKNVNNEGNDIDDNININNREAKNWKHSTFKIFIVTILKRWVLLSKWCSDDSVHENAVYFTNSLFVLSFSF